MGNQITFLSRKQFGTENMILIACVIVCYIFKRKEP